MKIISTEKNIFKCLRCNTVAEYEDSDVVNEFNMISEHLESHVKCPTCNNLHDVTYEVNKKLMAHSHY
jgi:Fe2+ or Zn2+ uptake regulation protein